MVTGSLIDVGMYGRLWIGADQVDPPDFRVCMNRDGKQDA